MEKITRTIVKKVSNLIKIFIPDEDLDKYKEQLSTSLEPAEVFKELNLDDIKPANHITGLVNRLDKDIPQEGLSQQDAIMNANQSLNGFIVVKRLIKNDH